MRLADMGSAPELVDAGRECVLFNRDLAIPFCGANRLLRLQFFRDAFLLMSKQVGITAAARGWVPSTPAYLLKVSRAPDARLTHEVSPAAQRSHYHRRRPSTAVTGVNYDQR